MQGDLKHGDSSVVSIYKRVSERARLTKVTHPARLRMHGCSSVGRAVAVLLVISDGSNRKRRQAIEVVGLLKCIIYGYAVGIPGSEWPE